MMGFGVCFMITDLGMKVEFQTRFLGFHRDETPNVFGYLQKRNRKWICDAYMEEFIITYLIISKQRKIGEMKFYWCVYVCTYHSKVFTLCKSKENTHCNVRWSISVYVKLTTGSWEMHF